MTDISKLSGISSAEFEHNKECEQYGEPSAPREFNVKFYDQYDRYICTGTFVATCLFDALDQAERDIENVAHLNDIKDNRIVDNIVCNRVKRVLGGKGPSLDAPPIQKGVNVYTINPGEVGALEDLLK